MPQLTNQLELDRCPHCRVDHPNLNANATFATTTHTGASQRYWKAYVCSRCGGTVTAASYDKEGYIHEMYPDFTTVSDTIPEPARSYLNQAIDSLHSPAGSVMLSASAVDAMLKAKSYKDGVLYSRINKAVEDHLITQEMAKWAHEVRLDANEQRHADEQVTLPTTEGAKRCIEFTLALGEFLFVLPSRVNRGIADASGSAGEANP